jgi:hypothetical protein
MSGPPVAEMLPPAYSHQCKDFLTICTHSNRSVPLTKSLCHHCVVSLFSCCCAAKTDPARFRCCGTRG